MFCISCGAQLEQNSQFCVKCGAATAPAAQGTPIIAPQNNKPNLILLWILLPVGLLVIGGTVLAVVLLTNKGGGPGISRNIEPGDTPEKTVARFKSALINEDFGIFKLLRADARKQLEAGKDQMVQAIQFLRGQDPARLTDEQKALLSLSDNDLRRMTFPQILKHMVLKTPKLKQEYDKAKRLNVTKVESVGEAMAKVTYTEDGQSKDLYLVKEDNK